MAGGPRVEKSQGYTDIKSGPIPSAILLKLAAKLAYRYLTLYAFSSENWQRPAQEVTGLMSILKRYLEAELPRMQKNDIRLMSIGDRQRLPESVREVLVNAIEETAGNSQLTLNLALSYGGRDELVRAVKKIGRSCLEGHLDVEAISEETICGTSRHRCHA